MTGAGSDSRLHQRLREACKAPHRALDHHPLLAPLVRGGLSRDRYGDALAALHGVFDPLEFRLHEYVRRSGLVFAYLGCCKLPALEDDLIALRRVAITTDVGFPDPASVPEMIGMLYTLEGSSMGGQAIARQLQQGSENALPQRFFSGADGDAAGSVARRWQAFWSFADAACPLADHDVAAAAAARLFGSIKQHLDAVHAALASR